MRRRFYLILYSIDPGSLHMGTEVRCFFFNLLITKKGIEGIVCVGKHLKESANKVVCLLA